MSKKILSKIKQHQQQQPNSKNCYRSSSVGNDSCLRDDSVEYSLMFNCNHNSTNIDESMDITDKQLRKLELINENYTKHFQINVTGNSNEFEESGKKYARNGRNNFYLQPPGPLNDFEHLKIINCCDLINSAYINQSIPKYKSTCYNNFEFTNNNGEFNRGSNRENLATCYSKSLRDTEQSSFKCRDSKVCTSMTYFSHRKASFPNDRISNSSDTSRQSSSSQHIKLGTDLFNRNPNCGVEYLRSNGIVSNDKDLAELFIKKKGFNKRRLFEFLTNTKSHSIHESFCNLLDLKNKSITEVLREYLKFSYITGEYNVMIKIVDALSSAYMKQHLEGGIMGLNIEQINTIFQFLITFNINEKFNKNEKISREYFIELLQNSLTTVTKENAINRQLASCLYLDISESPLAQPIDEKNQNLEKISKLLVEIPKGFCLMELHRYIICHVDLYEVVLPVNSVEKISYHDRTVFLFNDCLIITKKKWLYESNSYRVKQILNLSDIKCSFVKRNASHMMQIVQIINCISDDVIVSFYSKVMEDCTNFYSTLEKTINFHRTLVEYQRNFDIKSR